MQRRGLSNRRDCRNTVGDEGASFDLVVSDVVMPGMNGRELIRQLSAYQPDVPAVLTSGYPAGALNGEDGGYLFLQKPFAHAELLGIVEQALSGSQA